MKLGFFISDLSSGGAERATVGLSNYFATHGHTVEIITFTSGECFYPLDGNVKVSCADFPSLTNCSAISRITGIFSRMKTIRNIVRKKDLDVLIGMSSTMTYYSVFATIFTKTKSIGTERNNPYVYEADRLNAFLRKFFSHLTNGYVFQTKKAAAYFADSVVKKGKVIPNAIYNPLVYEIKPPESRKKIIYGMGRLTDQKRFDLLIEAFAEIEKKIPDYKLVIFGEGEKRNELESKINSLGLSDKISLPGTDNKACLKVADGSVFVLSSDFEGMPNALMESIASGIPCVSTRCDMGPEELIENEVNGLLVDTNNSSQIADSIMKIIENPQLAEKISENGRKILVTHSIDAIGEKWIEYLEKV